LQNSVQVNTKSFILNTVWLEYGQNRVNIQSQKREGEGEIDNLKYRTKIKSMF